MWSDPVVGLVGAGEIGLPLGSATLFGGGVVAVERFVVPAVLDLPPEPSLLDLSQTPALVRQSLFLAQAFGVARVVSLLVSFPLRRSIPLDLDHSICCPRPILPIAEQGCVRATVLDHLLGLRCTLVVLAQGTGRGLLCLNGWRLTQGIEACDRRISLLS